MIVKLKDIAKYKRNTITIADDVKYKRCRVQLHLRGVVLRDELLGVEIKTKKQKLCKTNDFIVAEMDAKFGGYGIIPKELDNAIVSSHYYLYELNTEKILPEYLDVFIKTGFIQKQIKATGSTNYSRVSYKEVLEYEIYCPDIEKQKKIVQFYNKLNLKLDRYKIEITTQKESITQLKQSILQEAIQGKLTAEWRKQNPDTEPASELLKRIKAEKEKLIKEKKIRKEKPLPPITQEDLPAGKVGIPFELPAGWVWCRLGEIYQSTSGGTPTRGNHEYWNGNIYWYKSGELNDGILENPSKEFITEKGLKESSATMFPKGTLLIAMYGATAGKLAVLNVEATTNQAVCGFYKNEKISTEYLFNYLLANRSKMIKESWGMSQPNISQTYLRNFVFALPPLAEQKAIVEKVENLMQKVSAMEEEINKSEQNAQMLMQAVLKEAFEGKKEEVEV